MKEESLHIEIRQTVTIKKWIKKLQKTIKQKPLMNKQRYRYGTETSGVIIRPIHDVFSLRFAVTGVKVIIYDLHVISASVYEFFAFSSVT